MQNVIIKAVKQAKKVRKTLSKTFKMAKETGIQDLWREIYPKKNQYSFYSNKHMSWSRIDMIWMSLEVKSNVQEIEISFWADHNPVKVKWKGLKRKLRWTLNQLILKDKEFIQTMEKKLNLKKKRIGKRKLHCKMYWILPRHISGD
uniref:Uncharacterized protein n=1 Tax=Micrurus paraensis TaxID=1970185 RepID=A0A2D4KVH3_9SAUR